VQYPCIEIDLQKIYENSRRALASCRAHGVEPVGVTKVCCAEPAVAETMVQAGFTMLADSRLDNLERIAHINVPKMLLRLPMVSEAERAVQLADVSLISEKRTAEALSAAAMRQNKQHGVILMMELGDLREGCADEAAVFELAKLCISLEGLDLQGIGGNLICYGGAMPSVENQGQLITLRDRLENQLGIKLPVVSGGNSAVENIMTRGKLPNGVNQLRIGAMIHAGIGLMDEPIKGYHTDAYVIHAEVIERNRKPTMPYGELGTDAFGQKRDWIDYGEIERAIVAIGRADCDLESLTPVDAGVKVLGASSDHLIVDLSRSKQKYMVGDKVSFYAGYVSILRACMSRYVKVNFKNRIDSLARN